jgi:S-DNA-T family DNA segregation ATPase FtsK/SpoIIIE
MAEGKFVSTAMAQLAKALEGYTQEQRTVAITLYHKLNSLGCLSSFAKVEAGPIITSYVFTPGSNAQLQKLFSDIAGESIAMVLGVDSVIITRRLGDILIAVPNKVRKLIQFDQSVHWFCTSPDTAAMALPLLLGQNPVGNNLAIDLAEQPHILVAGSTGSGKSILLSQFIASLVLTQSPQELSIVLVDTKQVDLTLFQELEHVDGTCTTPTDAQEAIEGLITEVRSRIRRMKGKARNLAEYNLSNLAPYMQRIVLVIDEYADVIDQDRASRKGVKGLGPSFEERLKELAQISRAAGVHIILATQRPSVKIISGDIKTNFPARICLRVPSSVDSRVVIEENGAERLLGKGDLLYRTAGNSMNQRAHSTFVDMDFLRQVVTANESIRGGYRRG